MRNGKRSVGRKKLVRKAVPSSRRGIAWPRWTGFRGMTVRNWLEILIVPMVLVGIGLLFEMRQDDRQQQIEEQRAQDAALQSYFDQMSTLLMDHDLRSSDEGSEVRNLARARTLTVLASLDPTRKTAVIRFLGDAALIQSTSTESDDVIIALSGADLSGVPLSASGTNLSGTELIEARLDGANLSDADLSSTIMNGAYLWEANLRGADLHGAALGGANLYDADLSNANLRNAHLQRARLDQADLSNADLSNADLMDAELSGANLRGVSLRGVSLRGAILSGADLSYANLSNAEGVTNQQLEREAYSLFEAIMPNGQKYED